MSAVAIIPAKGNSKRIPRKNIKLFHGKPIIAYSIELALNCGLFDAVWVSTEDDEIGHNVAHKYGAQWFKRSPELAEVDGAPDCGTQEVTRDVLVWLRNQGKDYKHACCVYPTAPMIHYKDLRLASLVVKDDRRAYAYATFSEKDAGQFYFGQSEAFIKRVPLTHWSTVHIDVGSDSYCDINTRGDWERAEKMYPRWKEKYGTV